MKVVLLKAPGEAEWLECKERAIITMGKRKVLTAPDSAWKSMILEERHSPIRVLRYSFRLEDIPSNTATHFARHVHAQPYVSSLRNDRQDAMDGDAARRDTPVDMILDVNAEELMVMSNKRMCMLAAEKTREVMYKIRGEAVKATPELAPLLTPACIYYGGRCHEAHSCGFCPRWSYESVMTMRDLIKEIND